MPRSRPKSDLSTLDDKLLDGLDFCSKVYDLFDQVRAEPEGLAKLRLLTTRREKRLLEELLPIAHYIQAHYRVGNRIKVRWLSGSQQYDAIIWSPWPMVKNAGVPRKIFLEVTTSTHKNAHLAHKLLHEQGGSFGPKGIKVNRKTGVPDSAPYVNVNDEGIRDLTVLIINCSADGLILEDEWNEAIRRVKSENLHRAFLEVFLIEPRGHHSAALWTGRRQRKVHSDDSGRTGEPA
jgi:hypothetical protein